MRFNQLSIARRLWVAVGLLIVALVSIVLFAGWRSASTQKRSLKSRWRKPLSGSRLCRNGPGCLS